jgi:Ca2+-binding RTX toxin-like protein
MSSSSSHPTQVLRKHHAGRPASATGHRNGKWKPAIETLEYRVTPAVTALFSTGLLSVVGDAAASAIVVSADATGSIQVTNNGQAVQIQSVFGTPNRASLQTIHVDAKGGNDSITLDRSLNTLDANGKLAFAPNAVLLGGAGDDFLNPLIGGFVGGLPPQGAPLPPIVGNVVQMGGAGNDFLNSGFGNDVMLGEGGNDTLQWLPGTLLDQFDGGSGFDTGVVVGNTSAIPDLTTPDPNDVSNADRFVLAQDPNNPGGVLFQRTNLVPFFITIDNVENVTMRTGAGNDTISIGNLSGTDVREVVANGGLDDDLIDGSGQLSSRIRLVLNGDDGNDALLGGAGADQLNGANGDDKLSGNGGLDILDGGDGNDALDGGKDGKQDVLIGGLGADTFTRYYKLVKVNGQALKRFDELLGDFRAAEGDLVNEILVA